MLFKIETKYNIGDKVFYIEPYANLWERFNTTSYRVYNNQANINSQPIPLRIVGVNICITEKGKTYHNYDLEGYNRADEDMLFETLEDAQKECDIKNGKYL